MEGGLGEGFPRMVARVYTDTDGALGVALQGDVWNYAYSAAHEIAELEYDFVHSAEMFCKQCNILSDWIMWLSTGKGSRNV